MFHLSVLFLVLVLALLVLTTRLLYCAETKATTSVPHYPQHTADIVDRQMTQTRLAIKLSPTIKSNQFNSDTTGPCIKEGKREQTEKVKTYT